MSVAFQRVCNEPVFGGHFQMTFLVKQRTREEHNLRIMDIEDYINDDLDFDNIVDQLELHIQGNNTNKNVEVKKVNLDCSSKYIQFVGISLLFLLL